MPSEPGSPGFSLLSSRNSEKPLDRGSVCPTLVTPDVNAGSMTDPIGRISIVLRNLIRAKRPVRIHWLEINRPHPAGDDMRDPSLLMQLREFLNGESSIGCGRPLPLRQS